MTLVSRRANTVVSGFFFYCMTLAEDRLIRFKDRDAQKQAKPSRHPDVEPGGPFAYAAGLKGLQRHPYLVAGLEDLEQTLADV